jgi:hypothetical protein
LQIPEQSFLEPAPKHPSATYKALLAYDQIFSIQYFQSKGKELLPCPIPNLIFIGFVSVLSFIIRKKIQSSPLGDKVHPWGIKFTPEI